MFAHPHPTSVIELKTHRCLRAGIGASVSLPNRNARELATRACAHLAEKHRACVGLSARGESVARLPVSYVEAPTRPSASVVQRAS